MIVNKILTGILINAFIIYVFIKLYILGIYDGFQIDILKSWVESCEVLFILGAILWFINDIVKYFIKLLALPFTFIFGWIILILINVILLYIFKLVVISFNLPVNIVVGWIVDYFIVAIAISVMNLLFKKL